jgi:CheY-like chemotaxis protein
MTQQCSFLYVEDDPISRDVIRIAFQKVMGYDQVSNFENSENFLDRAGSLPAVPDVILLDIHMKPIGGFEMLKLLRQNGKYTGSRIIALTASVTNEEVAMLMESSFDGGIGKPIDPDIFPSLIHRIIDGEKVWHITS